MNNLPHWGKESTHNTLKYIRQLTYINTHAYTVLRHQNTENRQHEINRSSLKLKSAHIPLHVYLLPNFNYNLYLLNCIMYISTNP